MSLVCVIALLSGVQATSTKVDCGQCHTTSDWSEVRFDHERTRLPLRGRHSRAACFECHLDLQRLAPDFRCIACHEDPHAGRLGYLCERCHNSNSFRDGAGVLAHSQTRFPLYGGHAAVPCDQCHQARSDLTFVGVPGHCYGCHGEQYNATRGTALDHAASGIDMMCDRCHVASSWDRGTLPGHDRCFPTRRGDHRGIGCLECHTSIATLTVKDCTSFTAACTRCHSCSRMDDKHRGEENISGYECVDRRCYECHPRGVEGDD